MCVSVSVCKRKSKKKSEERKREIGENEKQKPEVRLRSECPPVGREEEDFIPSHLCTGAISFPIRPQHCPCTGTHVPEGAQGDVTPPSLKEVT